jgi:multiple sugar transport system ATP-binding protein
MTMADKIVVMHDGVVEQIGAPLDLYDNPANLFVAGFIGSPAMNLIKGRVADGGPSFETAAGDRLPLQRSAGAGQPAIYGVRPEHLHLDDNGFPATIVVVEPMGSETQVIARLPGGDEVIGAFRERRNFKPGETIRLLPDPALIHLFDAETERRL